MNIKYFCLAIIFIAGYLGYQNPIQIDVSQNKINSLTNTTNKTLAKITKPLSIELFTSERDIYRTIEPLIELAQKENNQINFNVHYDVLSPKEKAAFGLQGNHNLRLTYGDRRKAVDLDLTKWNESFFSNLIRQIIQEQDKWIVFLTGHGELNPVDIENRHLNTLTTELKSKGMSIASVNLGETGVIPGNTQILVIADPQTQYLPQEIEQILHYIKKGGNLLWLLNPESGSNLERLSNVLGVEPLKKTIFDPQSNKMGTPHPAICVIHRYPDHPITKSLDRLTVFPFATALDAIRAEEMGWSTEILLSTNESTYLEETKNKPQSFTLGVALTKQKQRLLIIGNTHFLSNANIKNYGNLVLASHIFDWLHENEAFMGEEKATVKDPLLAQNSITKIALQFFFPYILSLFFFVIGWRIRYKRQRRYLFP